MGRITIHPNNHSSSLKTQQILKLRLVFVIFLDYFSKGTLNNNHADMKSGAKSIPEEFIYEIVNDKPVYYNGYRNFLKGKNNEKPMGSSFLQSMIITNLVIQLYSMIGKKFYILTNELGIQFSKGNFRAADIAIYDKSQIDIKKASNKYIDIPPKIVIEIDTKADIKDIKDTFKYYNEKTDQLINFGVEKVIWIFTDSQKVLVADKSKEWKLNDWSKDITIIEGVKINIIELIDAI